MQANVLPKQPFDIEYSCIFVAGAASLGWGTLLVLWALRSTLAAAGRTWMTPH
jgi:hypothetical protein